MRNLLPATPLFSLKYSVIFVLLFIGFLWLIKGMEIATGLSLWEFGILPLSGSGLLGILLAPLIHGSFSHLVTNTLPLFVLGVSLIHLYSRSAAQVLPIIYIFSGLGVWLFARPVYHIGASGLTYGMMFFIFVIGILRRDRLSIAVSMLVFFLYGGMVWGVLPREAGVSYEYHFFGAMTGIVLAFIMRDRDPKIPEKKYDWEDEADDEEDPVIGDEWRQP